MLYGSGAADPRVGLYGGLIALALQFLQPCHQGFAPLVSSQGDEVAGRIQAGHELYRTRQKQKHRDRDNGTHDLLLSRRDRYAAPPALCHQEPVSVGDDARKDMPGERGL